MTSPPRPPLNGDGEETPSEPQRLRFRSEEAVIVQCARGTGASLLAPPAIIAEESRWRWLLLFLRAGGPASLLQLGASSCFTTEPQLPETESEVMRSAGGLLHAPTAETGHECAQRTLVTGHFIFLAGFARRL